MKKGDDRTVAIYNYIEDFVDANGYPPSVREIGAHFGIKSTATVYYYLEKLRNAGKITQEGNKYRAMGLKTNKETSMIPLVGNVSAGQGILAIENIEGRYPFPKDIFPGGDMYMLRVEGESMINAGIDDGDFVVAHSQTTAEQGEIAVVMWQDKATIKRIAQLTPRMVLHPENDAMDDIIIEPEENPQVIGKVVGCIKKF